MKRITWQQYQRHVRLCFRLRMKYGRWPDVTDLQHGQQSQQSQQHGQHGQHGQQHGKKSVTTYLRSCAGWVNNWRWVVSTETEREEFEAWISSPPYEKSISKFPDGRELDAWPKVYRDLCVQLAWESWVIARKPCQQCEQNKEDAERCREMLKRYENAKTSQVEAVLYALGFDAEVVMFDMSLSEILDQTRRGE